MVTINYYDSSHVLQTLNVVEDDNSYRYRALMTKPQMVLKFALPEYVEIPIGAYVTYQGETFILTSAPNIKKQGTRNIEYTLNMGTYQDNMSLYKMRNSIDHRLKYSMCATPAEFIQEIVANLNDRDGSGVWHVGDCISAVENTIEFNHTYIDEALSMVAELFETEWEIVNHYIHLHKVEYNEKDPLPLSYGKGNGFVPGVGRTTPVGEQPIKRLYVQGGDRNIDPSKYGGAHELLLPKGQTWTVNGKTYQADSDGYYIERVDESVDSAKEDSIDLSNIYPSRVGTVDTVVVVDASRNWYDIIDPSIPADLNYGDQNVSNPPSCLIDGEQMTIIFQSGMLAGREFDCKYHHADRRFEIVPFEYDGVTMPNSTFIPAHNDKYAIFGIMLPNAYIRDDNSNTGASWDMFKEAATYLSEHEEQKFTFTGTLQGLWAKQNWTNVGSKLVVGGYIDFSDEQFAPDGTLIRITGIKDFLTAPYAPVIEISNGGVGESLSSHLIEIESQEVTIYDSYVSSINFTKRRFRDVMDTMIMLQESLLEFSEGINPITVQTMQALIGDASLQFVFVDDQDNVLMPSSIFYMNNETMIFSATNPSTSTPPSPLLLKHSELDSVIHPDPPQYMKWIMSDFVTPNALTNEGQGYYLYAKCSKTVDTGVFVLSDVAIALEAEAGYYHFLVGIIGKIHNGERSFVTLFGFTELLPGRVTTDLIISGDGLNYFDLVQGHIQANSAFIRGTFRSPFQDGSSGLTTIDDFDNIYFRNSVGDVQLDWDKEQSGRKICIAGKGRIMRPPTGQYVYCDGLAIGNPFVFDNEILTLVGYGDDTQFFGWIITNRMQIQAPSTYGFYGSGLKCIAMGTFERVDNNTYWFSGASFDGSNITVERQSIGCFRVNIPGRWFSSSQTILDALLFVLATPTTEHTHVAITSKVYDDKDDLCRIGFIVSKEGARVDGYFNFAFFNMGQCIQIMP